MSQCDILGCKEESGSSVAVTVLDLQTHNIFVHLCPRHANEYWQLVESGKRLFWDGECLTDKKGVDIHNSVQICSKRR